MCLCNWHSGSRLSSWWADVSLWSVVEKEAWVRRRLQGQDRSTHCKTLASQAAWPGSSLSADRNPITGATEKCPLYFLFPSRKHQGLSGSPAVPQFCIYHFSPCHVRQSPQSIPLPREQHAGAHASALLAHAGSSVWALLPPELPANMSSHLIKSEMPLTSVMHHYFCATRKEGMLPGNRWHAIGCKLHPNFEAIKWEENVHLELMKSGFSCCKSDCIRGMIYLRKDTPRLSTSNLTHTDGSGNHPLS